MNGTWTWSRLEEFLQETPLEEKKGPALVVADADADPVMCKIVGVMRGEADTALALRAVEFDKGPAKTPRGPWDAA